MVIGTREKFFNDFSDNSYFSCEPAPTKLYKTLARQQKTVTCDKPGYLPSALRNA